MTKVDLDFEAFLYCPLCGHTLRRTYMTAFPEIPYKVCNHCYFWILKETDSEET